MCETIGSICFTCFSTNRNLFPIIEHKSTIENWTNINVADDCRICWECTAVFRRIKNFKMQVLEASTLFNKFVQLENMTIPTLSKLTYVTNDTFDNIYNDTKKEVTCVSDNDDTIGSNIKSEWKEPEEVLNSSIKIEIEPFDSDNCEPIDDSFKTISAIEHVECNYGNVDSIFHDYNETGTVANQFQGLPGENIECMPSKIVDGPKKKDLNKKMCGNKTKPRNRSEKSQAVKAKKKETFTKMNNVKVCDRYKVLVVGEEEMLKERQKERESDKYVKSVYKCENCILGYTCEDQYLKHRKEHSETLKMKCPICECTFAEETSLEVHKKGHYQIYQCSECTYKRIRMNRILDHYGKHHLNQEFYTCSKCQMKFGSKSKLIHHRSKAHRPVAACETCGKEFSTKQCLKKHMLQHTGMPQYECGFCNKYYRGKDGLACHMRNVHGNTRPEEAYCAQCDVQFKGVHTYKVHLKTVHTSERVQCNECGKEIQKSYLSRHIKFMHSLQPIPDLPCHLCTKTFRCAKSLKNHIREIHENKPTINAVCDICAKPMKTKQQLREHLNTHTGSRPYECDKCSSTFKHKSALYTHTKLVHYKMKRSDKVRIVLKKESKIN